MAEAKDPKLQGKQRPHVGGRHFEETTLASPSGKVVHEHEDNLLGFTVLPGNAWPYL